MAGSVKDICPADPYGNTEHLWVKDLDDLRFRICIFCGVSAYRTDEELIADATKKGISKP